MQKQACSKPSRLALSGCGEGGRGNKPLIKGAVLLTIYRICVL